MSKDTKETPSAYNPYLTHYEVLGLKPSHFSEDPRANFKIAHRAFIRTRKSISLTDHLAVEQTQDAFDVLSDEKSRWEYDEFLSELLEKIMMEERHRKFLQTCAPAKAFR